uniref:Cadherin domain-containing protein n=1 Tax=Knipowitschia caucasica TaxID=637954 RepID=A0AAV2MJ81_KNICA
MTTGSRTSDFKFVSSYNDNTLPAEQTLRKSPTDFSDVFGDSDHSPEYNGEIRTMRMFSYRDPRHQQLVVVAKDNGQPSLSATVTIKLSTVETAVKAYSDMTEVPLEYDIFSDLNLYLVIGNSVLSERNSTIADSTLVSTMPTGTALLLAETRKGKLVVRQPMPKGSSYIVVQYPTGLRKNGNLYALKTFDYEIEKEFLFHIEARDSGSPPLSSNVTVHIIVVDQNDNAPVIVSPWRAHGSVVEEKIPRSTDKGSLVAKVIALDTDSVHNSRITYQFLQVTDATLFSLDQYNGEIRTMRMFSYRDPRHQQLVVVAKDNGQPSLSATVTIKLSTVETAVKAYSDMTEVPLEYDIFSDLNLYLVIGLGSVSFLLLITILVTIVLKCQKPKSSKAPPPSRNSVLSERNSTIADSTLVSNDAYWYSMFLAETRKGKLVVRQPMPKGSRYIVSSIPRGSGVSDTSGSAPSTLQFLQVTDATLFSLDQYNGEIRTMRMFSYRDPRHQQLVVVAKDNGQPSLSATVTIKLSTVETAVKAYSDMTEVPLEYDIFSDLNLYLVIGLGSVSFLLLITILVTIVLKCQKPKSSKAPPPSRNSVLSERNSTIADSTLVSNDAYWYSMFLAETRKGKLVVRQPMPKGSRYIVSSIPRGSGVSDTSGSAPSTLQYLVYFILEKEVANTSMSMLFSINPENGNLYALKTYDYEIEKEFLFHIEARDSGSPPLSSNVTVHIIVVDQNDNAPVIVSPWRAHGSVVEEKIPRSTDKGSLVAKVIALDTDSVHNSRITYQFLQVTDATLFSLDQYNGEIRTMRMFSYRDPRHQQLVVVAKDNGQPSLSATVTIKLSTVETAVKAYSDMTEVPLEYDIFSDLNLYLVIGLGSVSFLLLITILVTIVLKCQKPKSSKAPPPSRNSVLSERNSTIADSTLVSNDAYWYSMFLAETRKGKLVVRQPMPKGSRYIVSSIPRGSGVSDTSGSAPSTLQYLVYFILEKEVANTSMSMLFSINPENGNLYALKTFDYEIEKEFLFHIEARDSGSPPLSSNVTVHIIVVDQNDNAPVIVSPWRAHGSVVEEKIPRSTDKGSLVAKVIALDTDSVHNSRITYQFLQVTDATLFSLDQYNGEIRTMRMFSYRDPRHQQLVVVAKDNGQPSLSATVTIKLSTVETVVKAYSDMTEVPLEYDIFSDLNLYLVIGLGSVSFLLLITILVTIVLKCQKPKSSKAPPPSRNSVLSERNSTIADSTLVSNDAYWYSMFLAETRKGKLVVRQPMPKGSRYIVSSIPRGSGVSDTSGSAPSTLQSFYTIRVLENNAPGALLGSLTAFDPDLHENQYLVYFILEKEVANTSMSMLFSINPENGNLYALKTFDYEIEKEFLFHIEARDSGSPPLSSNVTVHIIVVDQNDNAPVIVSPWRAHGSVVEEKIPRSTDKGSLVAKVIALDTDSVHNSRITYQFLQVTDATLFSLDQYNGEIRTMRMFSYRDPRHQQLVVVAKDNGQPSLSATVTIKLSTVETAVKAYSDMTEVPLEYDIFSDLNLYLVIGLGSVSFLLLITILVTIVLKCQKPKSSKAPPPSRNSVLSERNSTIADSTLVSNDAYWYSMFLAETRKGKLVYPTGLRSERHQRLCSLHTAVSKVRETETAPGGLHRQHQQCQMKANLLLIHGSLY